MKLLISLSLTVLMTVGAARSHAQEAASPTPRPTPPDPPFLKETPDFAAWTIVRYNVPGLSSQPADAVVRSVAAPPKPESVTSVTKTGLVRHQVRKLGGGVQEDIWFEHGNRVTMESMWKIPVFQGETSGPKSPIGPDFPEASWINAGNFVGTQEAQNNTYFIFESQRAQSNAAQAKMYGLEVKQSINRVYIDAETRTPWLVQTGDVLQRYVYQTAPTAPLDVPPEYQEMFDNYEKRKAQSARKPIAP